MVAQPAKPGQKKMGPGQKKAGPPAVPGLPFPGAKTPGKPGAKPAGKPGQKKAGR